MDPRVTVLMAVHNGERYLREAVDSILTQSFSDFEFLIIDDGSTDGSAGILSDYSSRDKRLRVVKNADNIGLAASLNRGVGLARGAYIARMDADDISSQLRLEKQAAFLDQNPSVSLVAAKVRTIDERGVFTGYWDDDLACTSFAEMVRMLPERNCIAHPGVMMCSAILRDFRYQPKVKNAEDYHLWMRLVASGHRLEKIDEILLSYRVTPASVTSTSNKSNYWFKLISPKWHYLSWALANLRLGSFTALVGWSLLKTVFWLPVVNLMWRKPDEP